MLRQNFVGDNNIESFDEEKDQIFLKDIHTLVGLFSYYENKFYLNSCDSFYDF